METSPAGGSGSGAGRRYPVVGSTAHRRYVPRRALYWPGAASMTTSLGAAPDSHPELPGLESAPRQTRDDIADTHPFVVRDASGGFQYVVVDGQDGPHSPSVPTACREGKVSWSHVNLRPFDADESSRRARSRTWRSGRGLGAGPSGSVVSADPHAGRTLSSRQVPPRRQSVESPASHRLNAAGLSPRARLTHPATVHRLTATLLIGRTGRHL